MKRRRFSRWVLDRPERLANNGGSGSRGRRAARGVHGTHPVMGGVRVARFRRITPRVAVADLRRTMNFYTDVLGFRVGVLWPEGEPAFCILDRDEVSVGFFTPDEHRPNTTPGQAELYFDVEDVLGLHER